MKPDEIPNTDPPPATVAPMPKRPRGNPNWRKKPLAAAPLVVPAVTEPEVTASAFPGMTLRECCIDCTVDRCVITNKPHCGHPRKGGLSHEEMLDPVVTDLYRKARKALQHYLVDNKKD